MEKLKKIRFSIIVPIYNAEPYLRQCLDSLVQQKYKNFELILVDDGSKDLSGSICDFYGENYKNIKVFHKENGGLVCARNFGVEKAQGEYIGFVDSDDWVDENLLLEVSKAIDTYKAEIISYNVLLEFSDKTKKQLETIPRGYYAKEAMRKEIYPIMIYNKSENFYNFGIYPSVSNKFFLKELYKKCQCEDERITMGEDASCTYRSLLTAESLYLMPQYFYHYRQNEESMTNDYDPQRFEKYQLLLSYLDNVLSTSLYDIKRQLLVHKGFRVKHAILNESKAPVNFWKKRKLLKEKMKRYGFENIFTEIGDIPAGIATRFFIGLIKRRMYGSLLIMCEVFKKVHKF